MNTSRSRPTGLRQSLFLWRLLLVFGIWLGACCGVVHAQQPSAQPASPPAKNLVGKGVPTAKAPTAEVASPNGVAPDASALPRSGTLQQRAQSALGLVVFTLLMFGIGQLRRPRLRVNWNTVLWGLALQFIFALIVLRTPGFFQGVNAAVNALLGFSEKGAEFLFGNLVKQNVPVGMPTGDFKPMGDLPAANVTAYARTGGFFAFNVLPTIIFLSALSTLLYYSGVMQYVVGGLAWVMQRSMKTSGSETLSGAANIFLGQTEAPLFVRPFIAGATRSELMAIMVGGFSNIASGVLVAYVGMLQGFAPDIAGHLVAASIISAPASLAIAKLLLPESEPSQTAGTVRMKTERTDANAIDAAARGALEGAQLALNVGAMLIAFIALVAMLNALLGVLGGLFGMPDLSLQLLLGYLLSPVAWLLGVPWEQANRAGSLIGIKTALNEFVAYLELKNNMTANSSYLDPRSFILTAYALCGFANFSSIAIQVGGIGAMAPERRGDLSRLGLLAMVGGGVASCMTACVVGVLL